MGQEVSFFSFRCRWNTMRWVVIPFVAVMAIGYLFVPTWLLPGSGRLDSSHFPLDRNQPRSITAEVRELYTLYPGLITIQSEQVPAMINRALSKAEGIDSDTAAVARKIAQTGQLPGNVRLELADPGNNELQLTFQSQTDHEAGFELSLPIPPPKTTS